MTSAATFRPRLTGAVTSAVVVTAVAYAMLRFVVDDASVFGRYPFVFAVLLGLASLARRVLLAHRQEGLRLDATGLLDIHSGARLSYAEVAAIRVDLVALAEGRAPPARVVTVSGSPRSEDASSHDELAVRFADLGPGFGPRPAGIINIEGAPLALAAISARTQSTALYPPSWLRTPADDAPPAELPTAPPSTRARALPWWRLPQAGVGLVALAFKVLPKIGSMALKLLKSVKPVAAAVTIGAYTLIFSWKFALAFVGLIGVHECGHVFAMWRSGVGVKGIYFIPFVGGVAVSKGLAKTRAQSAYIAINGPVWGTVLAYICFAAFALTEQPLLAGLAVWGALLNLFNLLPIMPLDGGRILAALAYSSRRWGTPVVFASLALGGALAYAAGLELLLLMVLVGAGELSTTAQAAAAAPAFALVGERPLAGEEHEHFVRLTSPVLVGGATEAHVRARAQRFEGMRAAAAQVPMTSAQVALTLAAYFALALVLLALLWLGRHVPGIGDPLSFLR